MFDRRIERGPTPVIGPGVDTEKSARFIVPLLRGNERVELGSAHRVKRLLAGERGHICLPFLTVPSDIGVVLTFT
jgi:hypothetical protein